MGEKDITQKILLAYNDVFTDILNVLLMKGERYFKEGEFKDRLPRSFYKADGKMHETERDILKLWRNHHIRLACIGLENQTDPDADMPLRILEYDGAEYRAQMNVKGGNDRRYPVITIVLYFGTDRHWDKPLSLYGALDIPERLKPWVNDYQVHLFEVAWLDRETVDMFTSDFRIVADYFVQMRENKDYVPRPDTLKHVQEVMNLLSVMTKDHRFEDAYNDMVAEKEEARNMCAVLDKIEKRGYDSGYITKQLFIRR